jgi:hypothetical protein
MREECRGLGRRGATAAFVVVSLMALLGMVALAVDVGMLMKVRSDAQRAADAAALAGAQDFLTGSDPQAVKMDALNHALEYASRNYVGWKYVDTSAVIVTDSGAHLVGNSPEAYVQVIPDTQKVRVFIRRAGIATWFGSILHIPYAHVSVKAAAQAVNAGQGKCVKPFALPDIWKESSAAQDWVTTPQNQLPDIGPKGKTNGGGKDTEAWSFDAGSDSYIRVGDPTITDSTKWTGLGSTFRNPDTYFYNNPGTYQNTGTKYYDDYGRPVTIKTTDPNTSPAPGYFYPFVMGIDSSNIGAYAGAPTGGTKGANWYNWNISHCNPIGVSVSDPQVFDTTTADTTKPGNMVQKTTKGIDSLVAQDPLACWASFADPAHPGFTTGEVRKRTTANGPCDQAYPNWENSPRVMLVPLMDPSQIKSGRIKNINFNNLAEMFLEDQQKAKDPVVARFMTFAKGSKTGPTNGSLIKILQLVE